MEFNAGNLYEANKQLILKTEKPLTHLELANIQLKFEDFFETQVKEYAMLLCHEQRDFTVFHLDAKSITSPHFAAREALGCCTDRGEVYSIEKTEDDQAYEIWIKIDDDIYCYYLFPYDQAVIECQ
jgi:hypothetical protein